MTKILYLQQLWQNLEAQNESHYFGEKRQNMKPVGKNFAYVKNLQNLLLFALLCPKFRNYVAFSWFSVIMSRHMGLGPFDVKCVRSVTVIKILQGKTHLWSKPFLASTVHISFKKKLQTLSSYFIVLTKPLNFVVLHCPTSKIVLCVRFWLSVCTVILVVWFSLAN